MQAKGGSWSQIGCVDPDTGRVQAECYALGVPVPGTKVAAFDIEDTLLRGPLDAGNEITWTSQAVVDAVREISAQGFRLVLFSNCHRGTTALSRTRKQVEQVAARLGVPVEAYLAYEIDEMRKPSPGLWHVMESRLIGGRADQHESFYVGDEVGRPEDKSARDRQFAINCHVRCFAPEEFFLKEAARPYTLSGWQPSNVLPPAFGYRPTSTPLIPRRLEFDDVFVDVVLFVGPPGGGKSSFFERFFRPAGYTRIGQTDKPADAKRALSAALQAGSDCVLDGVLRRREARAEYIQAVRYLCPTARIRAFWFDTDLRIAKYNSVLRALGTRTSGNPRRVVSASQYSNYERTLEKPEVSEGFDEVKTIFFQPGSDWGRMWPFLLNVYDEAE